ncbi:MAG: hypothetical protein EOO36_04060 [Cytophagaceae bacterium]|nr:MAG: hypothetical protein EOO36_04060 [Cytophagaceae bacterium]
MTDTERQHLRRLQKQQRDEAGYVKVIADDLGLDDTTVYCYAQAGPHLGLAKCLAHKAVTHWGGSQPDWSP